MNREQWKRIEKGLEEAMSADPEVRGELLETLGAAEPDLIGEIEALLHAADQLGDFLEKPAFTLLVDGRLPAAALAGRPGRRSREAHRSVHSDKSSRVVASR